MNTHLIDSEDLDVEFIQGTIGGNFISDTGITGAKWSVVDGLLTAIDAEFENITVDGIIAENAYIDGLEAINVSMTGEFVAGDISGVHASMDATGIKFNDGSGGIVSMSAGTEGIGLAATDGANTMVLASSGIYMSVGGSFYQGLTTTKVVGGVTFQFVNGVLVL